MRRLALLACALSAGALAAPAHAARVSTLTDGMGVSIGAFVSADAGEVNDITVRHVPGAGRVEVRDTGGTELALAQGEQECEKTGTGTAAVVHCSFLTDGVPSATVFGDDLDDRIALDASGGPLYLDAHGGAGVDTLTGAGERDVLSGDAGADDLRGAGGRDVLLGDEGADTLRGGDGELDLLYGGPGDDTLDGEQGPDSLEGGDGADAFADSGTVGTDSVTYFNDTTDPAGVDVSLDGAANDGNAVQDAGATDDVGQSIESVQGSQFGDDLHGGPGDDFLSGQGGDDLLVGLGGADHLNGANGNDVLDARDDRADADLDCDNSMGAPGDGDRALLDQADPEPRNCETVERTAPPPGNEQPPGPQPADQQPAPGEPAPAGPRRGEPGVLCFPAPSSRCIRAADTYGRAVFPDLSGLTAVEASWALAKLGIAVRASGLDVERDRRRRDKLPKHPDGDRWKEGMVTGQTVKPRTRVTTGANVTVPVDLRLWEGPDKETCAQTGKELAGLDLVEWERMMKELGCKVDDVLIKLRDDTRAQREVDLNSGDRCEIVRSRRSSGKKVDATLAVPDDPRLTDLRLGFKESPAGPSFIASDKDAEAWTLPVTSSAKPAAMVVTVQDRTGALIDHADLYLDATGAGGDAIEGETGSFAGSSGGDRGTRQFRFRTPEEGKVRLVAVASDQAGNSLCGAAEIRVTDPGRSLTTVSANTWRREKDLEWKRTAGASARAAGIGDFFAEQASRLVFFLTHGPVKEVPQIAEQIVRAPDKRKALKDAFATHGATVLQIACGQPLSGKAETAKTAALTGGLVVTDGRQAAPSGGLAVSCEGGNKLMGIDSDNDILADPSGLIGPDGATLIGPDGATLIGPDGATFAPPKDMRTSQVINSNGGGLIGNAGNTAVAATGAAMMAAQSASMVAAGGGN